MNIYNVEVFIQEEDGHRSETYSVVTDTAASALMYTLEGIKTIPATIRVAPMMTRELQPLQKLILN